MSFSWYDITPIFVLSHLACMACETSYLQFKLYKNMILVILNNNNNNFNSLPYKAYVPEIFSYLRIHWACIALLFDLLLIVSK
jgi:hypothetical protein